MDNSGKLFLTVPAFNFLWSTIDQESGHFRRYTRGSLEKSVTSAGFKIIQSSYFFTYLIPAMILLGRKKKDDSSEEHKTGMITNQIISLLNFIDSTLFKLLAGIIPGASIILVAQKEREI